MPRRTLVLLLCATLGLAACGDDEPAQPADTVTATATATPSAAPSASATPSATPAPLEGATTDPVIIDGTNAETALLTAVRVGGHEGYDRVVFQFRDEAPGYEVSYVEPPIRQDGSGEPVELAGTAVLEIRMQPALDADLGQDDAPMTYTGPTRLSPGLPAIAELARVGGFEGVLTWAAGTAGELPFRVTTLQDPPRVVVDVATG